MVSVPALVYWLCRACLYVLALLPVLGHAFWHVASGLIAALMLP